MLKRILGGRGKQDKERVKLYHLIFPPGCDKPYPFRSERTCLVHIHSRSGIANTLTQERKTVNKRTKLLLTNMGQLCKNTIKKKLHLLQMVSIGQNYQ